MKTKFYVFGIFILTVLLIFGCKEATNPVGMSEPANSFLEGLVIDNQGVPVEGAGVQYIYSLTKSATINPFIVGTTTIDRSNLNLTQVIFPLKKRDKVTIILTNYLNTNIVADTIWCDTLSVGRNYKNTADTTKIDTVFFNSTSIPNGIYRFKIIKDSASILQDILVPFSNSNISTLMQNSSLALTNSSGTFNLPYSIFGFDLLLKRTIVSTTTTDTVRVSRSFKVVTYKSGKYSMRSVNADTIKGLKQVFIL